MDTLLDTTAAGIYQIDTASGSRYLIDMASRTAPRTTKVTAPADPTWTSETLRKDSAAVKLVKIISCSVGEPLMLSLDQVDLYEGYAGTIRLGTPVVGILELS